MAGRKSLVDPHLGELVRRRRRWRGQIVLADGRAVPLALPGGRAGPDPDAATMARSITACHPGWQPALAEAFAEHRTDQSGSPEAAVPPEPIYAAVITLDRELVVELGYRVPWDEEHTLGARFRGDELVELCGSVLEP